MSASKRDFTDFRNFPGKINEDTGVYEFPTLKQKDSKNRTREWTIFVRLIKDVDKEHVKIDWNLLSESQVPIKDKYFDDPLPVGIIAQLWVETGISGGKITRNAPTYIRGIRLEGNSNQRNQFQSALIDARSQFLKRQDRGGSVTEKKIVNPGVIKYYPMLAKPYKDASKHIKYPIYVQPKLDGVRCIMYLAKKDDPESIVAYSRNGKDYPDVQYLKDLLYPYLNDLFDEEKKQSIYLDGELYKHGKRLQDISGEARNDKNENKDKNEYHIYDCFYPLELETPFESRLEQLNVIFDDIEKNKKDLINTYIKRVPTKLAKDVREVQKIFDHYTKEKYEGVILRNVDGPYQGNPLTANGNRSNDLIKMKQKFSDEYEVIGYTCGDKGKDKNALIWIAKTKDGKEFNVTPKDMNYEMRYEIYADCKKNFDKKYKNRLLTVEYEDLSRDGIPLRAKGVDFRDYGSL